MTSIFQCRCGCAVLDNGREWVGYVTGAPHNCADDALNLMDGLAEDSLDGDDEAALLLPAAVNWWLACKQ